jgi:nitroreductase
VGDDGEVVAGVAGMALATDEVGLLEGLTTTRAIRRYRDEPVPEEVLRDVLFAATRAPSGSNRQPFRFVVLSDGPRAKEAKRLFGEAARAAWAAKRRADGYDEGSGARTDSPKARVAATMQHYVDHLDRVPVLILPCLLRRREARVGDGGSIYPACQNLLLAARALGYGGVMTSWHRPVEDELRRLLQIPEEAFVAGAITLGRPAGSHGPVRRRPLGQLVFEDRWEAPAPWALDPPGTRHTGGPPARR